MRFKVKKIRARQILNSKGVPTVEVSLESDFGRLIDSCPSGTSRGDYEAWEVRDQDSGVSKAVENVEKIIAPVLLEKDFASQKELDDELIRLDGTKNKSNLGVNAILPVSMAFCRAQAAAEKQSLYRHINDLWQDVNADGEKEISLPAPSFNILNGGLHSKGGVDFQEFIIVPLANPQEKDRKDFFRQSLKSGEKIYKDIKMLAKDRYGDFQIGIEGGVAPALTKPTEALDLLIEAAGKASCKEFAMCLDVAASTFYKDGIYKTKMGDFTPSQLTEYYLKIIENYPLFSIEDGFDQGDWPAWEKFKKQIDDSGKDIIVMGDDFLVTNPERIKKAQEENACSGLLLKLNQIGTVSEGLEAAALARNGGWKIMVSHRSGETMDDFIADLAVGIGADFIKSGAPGPKERMAKYNRLAEIEKELQ